MQQVAQRIVREVPRRALALDSPGRETDIAIDHGEFDHLPPAADRAVVRLMESEGMSATVSSIHINGWYGAHNKLDGARWIVRELFGARLDAEIARWVYVGDSTNDDADVRALPAQRGRGEHPALRGAAAHKPRYITRGERGVGFAEVARALLASRRA
jgi:hypothetical protein